MTAQESTDDIRRRMITEFPYYAPRALKIRPKAGGTVVPFRMNRAQVYVHERLEAQRAELGLVRALVLKGRQQGISTYVGGRFFHRVTLNPGRWAFILTHEAKATTNLFRMTQRYWLNAPPICRPALKASNAQELVLDQLGSGYALGTAKSGDTGRSLNVHLFHGCLGLDTPVVDGDTGHLKMLRDVEPGQTVMTHTGKRAAVSFVSRQRKQAHRVVLKGLSGFPLVATKEHRFWTRSGWRDLADIGVGDEIGFPVPAISDDVQEMPLRTGDASRPHGGGSGNRAPRHIAVDGALGLVLGLYLAEGTIIRQASGYRRPSGVTFTVHREEVQRTVSWLEALGDAVTSIRIRDRKDSLTSQVVAYGRWFAELVERTCGATDGKRLPSDWNRSGQSFVQGLVVGYLSGDGHFSPKRDRRISATSIRPAITLGMRSAIAALGYGWASIAHSPAALRNGRNEREQYVLRLTGPGVDALSALCGKPCVERKRNGNYGAVCVDGGYAWVPVVSKDDAGEVDVADLEVDDDDHSYCTIHGATHNSEVAFWDNADEHMAAIGQALPLMEGTESILESTANGLGDWWHSTWVRATKGESDYLPIFVPWFWQQEYRLTVPADFALTQAEVELAELYDLHPEQIAWRRYKIRTDLRGDVSLFQREYPCTPSEAFLHGAEGGFIEPPLVVSGRKPKMLRPLGAKVLGVDPADGGADETAIAIRQGKYLHPLQTLRRAQSMEVVGRVAELIDRHKPDVTFIDQGQGGQGSSIIQRLHELNYRNVVGVLFGGTADEPDLYVRKGDEMWGRMKEWLQDGPVVLPDDDVLEGQLTSRTYTHDSSRRLRMEPKEKLKERGLSSPDRADALALTFAFPVRPRSDESSDDRARRAAWWNA